MPPESLERNNAFLPSPRTDVAGRRGPEVLEQRLDARLMIAGTPLGRRPPTEMFTRLLKSTISGESQMVTRELPAVRTRVLLTGTLPLTSSGNVPRGIGVLAEHCRMPVGSPEPVV